MPIKTSDVKGLCYRITGSKTVAFRPSQGTLGNGLIFDDAPAVSTHCGSPQRSMGLLGSHSAAPQSEITSCISCSTATVISGKSLSNAAM